ncbi:MAG: ankyrin repeat domain-containing protein [Terracidiphilus sp.]|nr:ankyrin repeat domain-containing protein [Terracidiphilus sp.]
MCVCVSVCACACVRGGGGGVCVHVSVCVSVLHSMSRRIIVACVCTSVFLCFVCFRLPPPHTHSVASVRRLLGLRVSVSAGDSDGHTPLWYALTGGHVDCARALLNAGAQPVDVAGGELCVCVSLCVCACMCLCPCTYVCVCVCVSVCL